MKPMAGFDPRKQYGNYIRHSATPGKSLMAHIVAMLHENAEQVVGTRRMHLVEFILNKRQRIRDPIAPLVRERVVLTSAWKYRPVRGRR